MPKQKAGSAHKPVSRIQKLIAETKSPGQGRCRICSVRLPDMDQDIREWVAAHAAGKTGWVSWARLCEFLRATYEFSSADRTVARHAQHCLGLTFPFKVY